MNLLQKLHKVCPTWRETVASDPLDAAVELGLLEPEELDDDPYEELNFHD